MVFLINWQSSRRIRRCRGITRIIVDLLIFKNWNIEHEDEEIWRLYMGVWLRVYTSLQLKHVRLSMYNHFNDRPVLKNTPRIKENLRYSLILIVILVRVKIHRFAWAHSRMGSVSFNLVRVREPKQPQLADPVRSPWLTLLFRNIVNELSSTIAFASAT